MKPQNAVGPAQIHPSGKSQTPSFLEGPWLIFLAWLSTRAIILYLAIGPERHSDGDIRHYWKQMAPMFHGANAREVLVEYPLPVLSLLWPLDQVAGGHPRTFNILFASSMLLVDAGFTAFLFHRAQRDGLANSGVWFWILFGIAMGPVLIFRFDIVCGVLAGIALTYLVAKPVRSGAALALAVAAKLWPAALLPLLLIPRRGRKKVLLSAGITGGLILVACVMNEGVKRTLSPLTWQSARGLQIESVFASLSLIQRTYDPRVWKTTFNFGAVELTGPGVALAETASSVALLVCTAALTIFVLRQWRTMSLTTLSWTYLLIIAVLIGTNKTYSAQYVIWLAAPLAVFLPTLPGRVTRIRLGVLTLILAFLTQLEYPILYGHLWPNPTSWDVIVVLVTRNALFVVLIGLLGYEGIMSAQRDRTSDRSSPLQTQ